MISFCKSGLWVDDSEIVSYDVGWSYVTVHFKNGATVNVTHAFIDAAAAVVKLESEGRERLRPTQATEKKR